MVLIIFGSQNPKSLDFMGPHRHHPNKAHDYCGGALTLSEIKLTVAFLFACPLIQEHCLMDRPEFEESGQI